MKRSTQLVLVYAELRAALGDTLSAGDVLDIAERLTDLANYRELIDRCGTVDTNTPGCVPLDRAFDDGGWALLQDVNSIGWISDDDPAEKSWLSSRQSAQWLEHWA